MTIAIAISIISILLTSYFAFKNMNRQDSSGIEEKAKEQAIINVKLDTIAGDVRDIKYDITETKRQVNEHDKKIALIDSSIKSLHHRLDEKERE